MILKTAWKQGSPHGYAGPFLLSATGFNASHFSDTARIWSAGLRLRRGWPELPGAIGMCLWAAPLSRHSGSVSAWESAEALRAFVNWAPHVEIMKEFRERGTIRARTWQAEAFTPRGLWQDAERRLLRATAP